MKSLLEEGVSIAGALQLGREVYCSGLDAGSNAR